MLAAGQGSLEEHCSGEFLESTLIYLPPRWDPGFTADMDLTEAYQVQVLGPPGGAEEGMWDSLWCNYSASVLGSGQEEEGESEKERQQWGSAELW